MRIVLYTRFSKTSSKLVHIYCSCMKKRIPLHLKKRIVERIDSFSFSIFAGLIPLLCEDIETLIEVQIFEKIFPKEWDELKV